MVFEGTTIDLLNDSVILSYSPIYFSGKSDNPILIKSSDKSGQGIAVINSNNNIVIKSLRNIFIMFDTAIVLKIHQFPHLKFYLD